MRVLMLPHPDKISGNRATGIDQVIIAYARYLPEFGIELVSPDSDNYDIIVSHAGLTGPVCDVAMLHGIHWTADYDAPDWEYRVNARIVEAVRHAKIITVPSEWVAETIRRDLRINPIVIPHGITWADWQHNEPHGDYILWNKNRADPSVCNPMPLVHLANRFSNAHFVTTFLPEKTARPQNTNAIGLIPHTEMKKLVQSALVYLATTKETFGIGILEAMAAGVPVLGYAHGGILDLVEHGVSGYLAQPGDVDGLAEGLEYCIRHRRVLGENGRELARAWTWEAACARVTEVYRQAAVEESPTVGIVIPVYNKTEEEIERAIRSVLTQTYDRIASIIVVDDGSREPAGVGEICARLSAGDKRIQLIRQDNAGVANARNRGIGESRTKYICCLDSDDWIAPDFLRVCVNALEGDRSLGIAYTGLYYHKPDGTHGVSPWPTTWNYDNQLQKQNQVPTCCVFRREMWQRLGGYRQRYAPQGCGAEDGELWLRAGAYGWKAQKVTDEALFHYSWMSGLASGNPDYKEPDWLLWHPWTRDGQHPFASYATPKRYSHPVRAYDQPAVSVVIPVGPGHEREVINALDSLEAQTFRQWEAIVVWDCTFSDPNERYKMVSKPEIATLEKAYPYVRFEMTGEAKSGPGIARNLGAKLARAPFLVFLDADDWLYPAALDKMITAWNANQAIVYTDYVGKAIVDDPGRLARDLQERLYHYDEKRQEAVIGYRASDFDCERALAQPELPKPYIWCNVTALIPKTWHDEIGGFDEKLESWEDVDYHWRMARAGHCYHRLAEELMVYRFYTGSRRDAGLQKHKNLVQYISRKYEKDGDIVGCRGCPGGGRAKKAAAAAPVAGAFASSTRSRSKLADTPGDDDAFIKVRIVDGKRGAHPVTGSAAINPATGRRFDYGMRSDGDIILAHQDDVYLVDKHSGQRVLRDPRRFHPIEERIVEPPPAEPRVTPPPKPIVAAGDPFLVSDHQPDWQAIEQVAFVEFTREANLKDLITTGFETEPDQPVFNPQMLPGVNVKVAEELIHRGLDTRAAILAAGVAGLLAVPGIGEKKAHKIVEYLSK